VIGRSTSTRIATKVGTAAAYPEQVTGDHAELIAVEAEWAKAIVSNDADQIGRFMDDEWVIVSSSGISTKDDFLTVVRSGALTHSAMDRVGDARVRIYGEIGVVTARVTNVAHFQGERLNADEWTTDVFVRHDDSWRCVVSQITAAG
jgi:ketosteroid isomerase-like protein